LALRKESIDLSSGLVQVSRRRFLQGCALAALTPVSVLPDPDAHKRGAAQSTLSLDKDWRFGRLQNAKSLDPHFDDSGFEPITLPHTVAGLSWQKWDPATWQDVWCYRRHFDIPCKFLSMRMFLRFDRVMAGATVYVNGHALPQHLGGFLPFEQEISGLVRAKDNVLAVAVDARWLNVPPAGSPLGPSSIDYLLPGGITGSVSLRAVPAIFIRDIFAKPVQVLEQDRHIDIACVIDGGRNLPTPVRLEARLFEGSRVVAATSRDAVLSSAREELHITLERLGAITLWDVNEPFLYDLEVTLLPEGQPLHSHTTRIGLREALFTKEGFFLNGRRLQLFGLNRHELYPYIGFAAPRRILRRDAEILRRDFHCNIVRCSHYPPSEAFLEACDELGLLVWEEIPGWQYVGDEDWQKLALRDVEAMILRDRNHPSDVIWGVRVNESPNNPGLYQRTRDLARSLDDSRPTSGSMTPSTRRNWQQEWHQDVFAFDDYHAASDGSVGIEPPVPGVPYMLAEAVGQFDYSSGKGFNQKYRRAGDVAMQARQALLHAEAHNKAATFSGCAGVIAWCAFDYASLINSYDAVKCPGIADSFRIPKLGAAFYLAQIAPDERSAIEPSFYWDFGSGTPNGPGDHAAIFSNCDRLELFIDGTHHATLSPERASFPNLRYPPFFADLHVSGARDPTLRIDGYVNNQLILSRRFSADRSEDKLLLHADDLVLDADGADATRLTFGVTDNFGNPRLHAGGSLSLVVHGPGAIVGDNPFRLEESGGMGAVWLRTMPGSSGRITIEATHSHLGKRAIEVRSQ
jgi:beta-galactosidase